MKPVSSVLDRSVILSAVLLSGLSAWAQFGASTALVSFGGSAPLRAADVDGDTDMDLIGLFGGHTFKWYPNTDGAGDFAPLQTAIDVASYVGLWEIADVDGDALPDVVYSVGAELFLLTNAGGGNFALPQLIGALPAEPGALKLADITGEGFRDAVVTLSFDFTTSGLGWLPNTGAGFGPLATFDAGISGPVPTDLAAADIDMAGGIDVVVGNWNQVLFAIRNMAGDASTWEVDTILSGPDYGYERVQLIDVDNDGDLDVAEAGAIALHWAENHTGEGGAWTEFTDHVLEPWTTAGLGMFGRLGCGAEAAAVYVPSNPGLPVRYTAWADGINTLAYSNDLPGIERGTGALLVDLTGDGQDELVLTTEDGAVWFMNTATPPSGSVVLPVLEPLCLYGPGFDLPEAMPAGGRWSGSWVIDNVLHRSNLGQTTNHPLAYTVYEPEGCPIASTGTVLVVAEPVISPALPSPICSIVGPIQMTSVPPASQWIGLGPNGILDPGTFTGDLFVALYVDPTGTDCAAESAPVVIWSTLPAEIAPTGPFCINDGPQHIEASAQPPMGAYWSGDISSWNTSGATFLPSQGAGTYQVILHVDPIGPQQCANSDTLLISVSDAFPTIELSSLGPQCAAGAPIVLDGATPLGGMWNGPGVLNGTLDPNAIGAGTYFLTYTYEEPGGCASSEALRVELYDATHVSWTVPDLVFCGTDEIAQFSAFPVGGTWSQPVDDVGTLDPALLLPGTYPLVYTWIGPNGCTLVNVGTIIELWSGTEVVIDTVGLLCDNGAPVALIGSHSGLWSGSVTGSGTTILFDPTLFGAGTWPVTLTATAAGFCPGTTSTDITVEICTSVAEPLAQAGMVLAPNPFQERFTIAIGQEKVQRIEVLDATGRLVSMATGPFSTAAPVGFDLSGQPSGAYVVRVHGDGSVYMVRAIKAD